MPSTHSAFQTQRLEAGGESREASLHPRTPVFELEAATCVMELRREGFQAALIEQLPQTAFSAHAPGGVSSVRTRQLLLGSFLHAKI